MERMQTKNKLVFILLIAPAVLSEHNEYCELKSCSNESHTLCKYQELGLGPRCVNPYKAELPDLFQYLILTYHNDYRNRDTTQRRNLPFFTNNTLIPILGFEWDEELALIAQRWANQCESVTDACRNVARFNITQRVAIEESSVNDGEFTFKWSIQEWFEQERMRILNFQNIRSEEVSSSASNHFLKLPWGNANKIGCGLVQTKNCAENKIISYTVCNYGYMNPNRDYQ